MEIYCITNGYVGSDGDVACFVIAENRKEALEKGREHFLKEYKEWNKRYKNSSYTIDYYEDLSASLLCDDTNKKGVFYST